MFLRSFVFLIGLHLQVFLLVILEIYKVVQGEVMVLKIGGKYSTIQKIDTEITPKTQR